MYKKPDVPTELKIPFILMCAPFYSAFNNKVKNNDLMKDGVKIDYNKAFQEWLILYRYIASQGLVYVLPNEGIHQDQVYVANLGLVMHHLKEPTVILSNYTSPPRRGEEKAGYSFFQQMKYKCVRPDSYFEGEADCKYIRDNIYIAGYGIRTALPTYQWMMDNFDCNVIPVEMTDKKLYHWDCIFFPLNSEAALVNTSVLDDNDIRNIEKVIKVIDVPKTLRYSGITNLCRVGDTILCRELEPAGKKWLDSACSQYGLNTKYFSLNSQDANGADLSCLIMHMNFVNFSKGTSIVVGVKNFLKGGM